MPDLRPGLQHLSLRDEDLRLGIELLFYAYRDFTAEPDRMLEEIGFGRAHHRAIYFVGRYPGINVGELLAILRITKQSLSRVLGELVRKGYILQRQGTSDRRQRRLDRDGRPKVLRQRLGHLGDDLAGIQQAWRIEGALHDQITRLQEEMRHFLAAVFQPEPPMQIGWSYWEI